MARPLKVNSGNLQQMTDGEMEELVYYLQYAYAAQLNADGMGSLKVQGAAGNFESVGSMSDTRSTQEQNTQNAPSNDGTTQSHPSFPGIGSETVTSYTYCQAKGSGGLPAFPTDFTHSFLKPVIVDGLYHLQLANTAADFFNDILSLAITAICAGNEVGSYRVSTSNPFTSGNPGTWVDKGTWFNDTRYNNVGNTTYKLWLKTGRPTPSGETPVGFDAGSGSIKQLAFTQNEPIIQTILLPALTRRIANGNLTYVVNTNAGNGVGFVQRGSFANTKYNQATNTNPDTGSGMSQVYISRSTPNTSGSTATVETKYLHIRQS